MYQFFNRTFTQEYFGFAAPCNVGALWFVKNLQANLPLVGIPASEIDCPFPLDYNKYALSIVRHPFDWLSEFYQRRPQKASRNKHIYELRCVTTRVRSFTNFIEVCAKNKGCVANVFDAYKTTSVIRYEDIPWAVVEFLQTLGFSEEQSKAVLKEYLPFQLTINDSVEEPQAFYEEKLSSSELKRLRSLITNSERDYCERYNYY